MQRNGLPSQFLYSKQYTMSGLNGVNGLNGHSSTASPQASLKLRSSTSTFTSTTTPTLSSTTTSVASSSAPSPGSYSYTSSPNLMKLSTAKPIPPPTVSKYQTSSVSATKSYRLSSLDRLAQRHQQFEIGSDIGLATNAPTATPPPIPSSIPGSGIPAMNGSSSWENSTSLLQSKREQFFKSDSTSSTGSSSMPTPAATPPAAPAPAATPPTPSATTTASAPTSTTSSSSAPPSSATAPSAPPTAPTPSYKETLAKRAAERGSGDCVNNEDVKERFSKPDREKVPERKTKELDGYVGFANLPNQVYRKAVKKGFDFTLMLVGESGLGKATLINSLFLADIYSNEHPGPSLRVKKSVQVETSKCLLKENGVNLLLTVVDTPGFGDAVDNSNCWSPIVDYIESKYEEYLNAESRVNRKMIQDSRVDCCLYFVAPSGHGLKPLDIEFMQRLHDKVNIIPVIAKADTMTPEEIAHFKKQILNEIAQHKIKIYEFPDVEEDEDGKTNKALRDRVPFAVVGSNTVLEVDGKKVRGRKFPWGIAEVENLDHCDFIALRNMLIRTHLQDLKDVTNNVHYENYRCRKLAGLGSDGKPARLLNKNPLTQMEEEKRDHEAKMKKMELEMEQVFEMKVKEKRQKIKDSEAEMQRRHEQTKKSLEIAWKEMDEKRQAFEKERETWELSNGVTIEELRRKSLEASSKEMVDGKEKKIKKKGLF